MTTANGMYSYDYVFYNKKLSEWIEIVHKDMTIKSGWNITPLIQGQFGYDNYALSIGYFFTNYNQNLTDNELASLVHDGWTINYIYWRDHEPWKKSKDYYSPASPLGDVRRNDCANKKYKDLNIEEQKKDLMVVYCILENLRSIET